MELRPQVDRFRYGPPEKSIIDMKPETKRLALSLIIAISKLTIDPNYNSYRGCKIRVIVQRLLETTGIDLAGNPRNQ